MAFRFIFLKRKGMRSSCDDSNSDPAEHFTRRLDRLKMFFMIPKISTHRYSLRKEWECFEMILAQLKSKSCFT